MDVRWYGVAGGSTGYAVEARAFVGALRRFGHPVDFREIRTDYALVPSDEQPPATDLDVLSPADVVVVHHPWPGLPAGPGLPPVVWRTMFETTRAPTFFAREAQRTQGIWVPSRFCREVLADSGIPRGLVHLLPPGLPDHIEAASPASPREPARVFTFLSLFRWQLRKGWDVLVDAFASEFRGVDDVRLVIKTDPFDRAQPLVPHRQLADRLTDLRRRLGDRLPPISLDVRELSSEAVVELYRSADAFVLPSRGELGTRYVRGAGSRPPDDRDALGRQPGLPDRPGLVPDRRSNGSGLAAGRSRMATLHRRSLGRAGPGPSALADADGLRKPGPGPGEVLGGIAGDPPGVRRGPDGTAAGDPRSGTVVNR